MRFVTILVGLMVATSVMAKDLSTSMPNMNQAFDTADQAAIAGLKVARNDSMIQEYAGVVFSFNGKFYFTAPVSSHEGNAVEGFHILKPRGSTIVALFHTHPAGPLSTTLSGEDVEFANQMHWNSYVAYIQNQNVVVYVPGKTRTYNTGVDFVHGGSHETISDGDLVGSLR